MIQYPFVLLLLLLLFFSVSFYRSTAVCTTLFFGKDTRARMCRCILLLLIARTRLNLVSWLWPVCIRVGQFSFKIVLTLLGLVLAAVHLRILPVSLATAGLVGWVAGFSFISYYFFPPFFCASHLCICAKWSPHPRCQPAPFCRSNLHSLQCTPTFPTHFPSDPLPTHAVWLFNSFGTPLIALPF